MNDETRNTANVTNSTDAPSSASHTGVKIGGYSEVYGPVTNENKGTINANYDFSKNETHNHYYPPTIPPDNRGLLGRLFGRREEVVVWRPEDRTPLIKKMQRILTESNDSHERYVYIELGLKAMPQLVAPTWLKHHKRHTQEHIVDQSPLEVFDQSQSLLIVGAPGAGKSTLLRKLCGELLARAETDVQAPIAVILNLASYSNHRGTFEEWAMKALADVLVRSLEFCAMLYRERRVLLLLDGLDEVTVERRDACVAEINRVTPYLQQVVVCSRSTEYSDLQSQLAFENALKLQPIPRAQALEYLQREGRATTGIREALQRDPMFAELLETPLMLHVALVAYAGNTTGALKGRTQVELRTTLYDVYVQRMLSQSSLLHHSPQQVFHWLRSLAMALDMQYSHYGAQKAELLQPTLLSHRWYLRFIWVLISGLMGGLLGGLLGGLFWGLGGLFWGLLGGLFWGLLGGLGSGILVGLVSGVVVSLEIVRRGWLVDGWQVSERVCHMGLKCARVGGLVEVRLFDWVIVGIVVIFFVAISGGCFEMFFGADRIGRLEFLPNVKFGVIPLIRGLVGELEFLFYLGPISGLVFGVMSKIASNSEKVEWAVLGVGAVLGMSSWLVSGLINAALVKTLDQSSTQFNQSIYIPFHQGCIEAVINGLIFGLFFGLGFRLVGGLISGLVGGLVSGLVGGLAFGGVGEGVKHYILRFLLWREGKAPLQYVDFLENCCALLLLRRFGKAYQFYHLTLRDYFAALSDERIEQLAAGVGDRDEGVRGEVRNDE